MKTETMGAGLPGAALREASVRRKTPGSLARYERAQQSLAGGVSTALRRSARPYPLYFAGGKGSRIVDVDGNSYIDYTLAWGPLILGHAPFEVVEALSRQLDKGFTYGAQHDLEFEVAERLVQMIPCAERVAFANSGTEIVQVALRLARAATGRQSFLKFEGHYHGWDDSVLVSYKPSLEAAEAAGQNPVAVGAGQRPTDAVIVQWNDREGVEQAFEQHGGRIASIICEPVLCNNGCIPPETGFLEFLREISTRYGALLIFDEVITGFRLGPGGAQEHYGVTPDLATFAKAAGGGLPLSVLAGKAEYMDLIAQGKAVHAGTLNGNPLALAAARATLDTLVRDNGEVYRDMWRRGDRLRQGLQTLLCNTGLDVVTNGLGPVFQLSFMKSVAKNYRDTLAADSQLYAALAMALLDEGVLVLPDGRWYLSAVHSDADIEATLAAAKEAVRA